MPFFTATYSYSGDVEARDRVRPDHREYLGALVDQGQLLLAGGFGPDDPAGAMLIFTASDIEEVRKIVAADPFSISGVIMSTDIRSWTPVLGASVAALSAPTTT